MVGIAVLIAAIFWPGRTSYVAGELIGRWAISIGTLEFAFAKDSGNAPTRLLLIIGAVVAILIGMTIMKWTFAGAAQRCDRRCSHSGGVALVLTGMFERSHRLHSGL